MNKRKSILGTGLRFRKNLSGSLFVKLLDRLAVNVKTLCAVSGSLGSFHRNIIQTAQSPDNAAPQSHHSDSGNGDQ